MESAGIIMLRRVRTDPFELEAADLDAAIELVRTGLAHRVRLVGLSTAGDLASVALARAQAADVDFTVDRHHDTFTLTIGPRHTRP
jgi:hypothetical protein